MRPPTYGSDITLRLLLIVCIFTEHVPLVKIQTQLKNDNF